MAKSIAQLDDMEAIYSPYLLTSKYASGLDLDDPPSVQEFVRTYASETLGEAQAKNFMALFESEATAAETSRACLAVIESNEDLLEGAADQLKKLLIHPPKTRQADLGMGLGLLPVAGMAMFLSGSLKVQTKDVLIEYKGSYKGAEVIKAVFDRLSGW